MTEMGETGAVIEDENRFPNPDGESQSDTSKLIDDFTQSAGNYPADQYFYRQ